MAHSNGVSNGVAQPLNGNGGDEPSGSRKRKREDDEAEDESEMGQLRAKLKRLERENGEMKEQLNEYETRMFALDPNLKSSEMRTHLINLPGHTDLIDYRSPPFSVDDVDISVSITQDNYTNGPVVFIGAGTIYFTPHITMTADGVPRFVLAMVTVSVRTGKQSCHSSTTDQLVMANKMEYSGERAELACTSFDPAVSRLIISITAVVQKMEMPGSGSVADSTAIVVVKDKEFTVSTAYLSQWSRYFRAYFAADMEEKKCGIYPIKDDDITAEDFQEMLLVIYPTEKPVTVQNYIGLLKLANRFEMPNLKRRVERFFLDFTKHNIHKGLLFVEADESDLQLVQAMFYHRWRDVSLLKCELLTSCFYKILEPVTKHRINQLFTDVSILFGDTKCNRCSRCSEEVEASPNPYANEDDA